MKLLPERLFDQRFSGPAEGKNRTVPRRPLRHSDRSGRQSVSRHRPQPLEWVIIVLQASQRCLGRRRESDAPVSSTGVCPASRHTLSCRVMIGSLSLAQVLGFGGDVAA